MAGALMAALAISQGAQAAVTVYSSQSDFLAANVIANTADFEATTAGFVVDPFTEDGITFHNLAGGALYIAPAHAAATNPDTTSQVLEANGDENFQIALSSGLSFGAIGFEFYSNAYGPTVFSLFSAGGGLIGSFTSTQAPNTLAFIGFGSTDPIAYVRNQVDRGYVENTAIDNVLVGAARAETGVVPEPATWAMMIIGFGAAGSMIRRRKAVIA